MFFLLRRLSSKPIIGFLFKYIYRVYNVIYGASIPLSVEIDESVRLPHGIHGIFISKNAVIGKNVTIFHQVTIGSIQIEGHIKNGAPTIGDNCLIGVGAKIIGRVTIGDSVYLASNVSVSNDIRNNVTVVPSPHKIIQRTNANL